MKLSTEYRAETPMEWRLRKLEEHRGDVCTAGLDLGSVSDLTALVLLFEQDFRVWDDGAGAWGVAGGYDLIPFFWVPGDGQGDRDEVNWEFYKEWFGEEGDAWPWMIRTGGRAMDYARLRLDVSGTGPDGEVTGEGLSDRFDIQTMGVDRWEAEQLMQQFQEYDGIEEIYKVGQGYASMKSPCKRWEELVLDGLIDHGGNPVMRWMVENCIVTRDAAGNMKPDKEASGEKIDGVVAGLMALARRMVLDADEGGSVYDTRGIELI